MLSAVLIYKFLYADKVQAGERNLTDEQWSQDIDFMSNTINNDQHALFDSKKNFNEEINYIKKNLHNLSDTEIELRLMEATASIGNDHTYILLDYSWPTYPIYLSWCGSELRVMGIIDSKYEYLLGKKLISINGIKVEQAIDKLKPIISHETDQLLKAKVIDYIIVPSVLKYCGVIKDDKATWTFQDDNGHATDVVLPVEQWDNKKLESLKINPPTVQSLPKPDANSFTGYWYKYMPDDKILYFQYNTCLDRYTAGVMKGFVYNMSLVPDAYPDFSDFLEGLYKIIDYEKIEKFIIDMRRNSGGVSVLLDPLISKLSHNENINKKGNLFVLIGKNAFSASVRNCLSFKENTNAIFVGEPTGGIVNCTSNFRIVPLPNSKLTFSYAIEVTKVSDKYDGPIIPDIMVNQNFQDYINGIDDIYEAAKNYKN